MKKKPDTTTFGELKVGDLFHCNLHLENFSYVYTKLGDKKCISNGYMQDSIYHHHPEDGQELGMYSSDIVKTVVII